MLNCPLHNVLICILRDTVNNNNNDQNKKAYKTNCTTIWKWYETSPVWWNHWRLSATATTLNCKAKILPCLTPIKLLINIQGMSITHQDVDSVASGCWFKLYSQNCTQSYWSVNTNYAYIAMKPIWLLNKGSAVCSIWFSIRLFCETTLKRTSIYTRVQVFIFLKVSSITTTPVPPVSLWGNRWSIVLKKNTMYNRYLKRKMQLLRKTWKQ